MAEYDAFGRKVGEDALAESGWRTGGNPPPPEAALAPPAPPVPPANLAPPAPPTPRAAPAALRLPAPPARNRMASLVGISLLIAVIVAAGAAMTFVGNKVDSISEEFPKVTVPSIGPAAPAPAEAIPPAGSLIDRARFGPAVRKLRTGNLGSLVSLRVQSDRIDAQLKTRDGRLRFVQIGPSGKVGELSITEPGFNSVPTMSFESVSSAAPERLARRAAKQLGVSVKQVNYLVVLDLGGQTVWSLFFKDGKQFQGDAAGHLTRRIN